MDFSITREANCLHKIFLQNCVAGVDPSLQAENRIPGPSQTTAAAPKQQKPRPTNSRDERFRSGRDQRGQASTSGPAFSPLFFAVNVLCSAEEIIFT